MKESVSLVNEQDQMFGTMDKMAAHQSGALHRALSVFVFNSRGELLLQQRAPEKYHSGGLWTNTCCSHPRLGESMDNAAYRRLQEEMGIHCLLDFVFKFTYRAEVGEGMVEHEIDHVFFGVCDDVPVPNPAEVNAYQYMGLETLANELRLHPETYTPWLNICIAQVTAHFLKLFNYEIL